MMLRSKLSRRSFMASAAAGVIAPSLPLRAAVSRTRVLRLRTAQLDRPLGIENAAIESARPERGPMLSWQIHGERRGVAQRAYRIRVASSARALAAGAADLWDSGRVESDISTGVPYAGQPLQSRQRAYWNVMVWDERDRASAPSPASWWEMGLLNRDDWSADWLAAEDATARADRLAGMTWVGGSIAAAPDTRQFRLAFFAPFAAQARLVLAITGDCTALTVDGVALVVPAHDKNAFGGPPAMELSFALPAGEHVIVATLVAARGFRPQTEVAVAAQLRLSGANEVLRISEGWQTSNAATATSGEVWEPAKRLDPQPIVPWPPTAAMLLRREFRSALPVQSARLYCAALGSYELRLNGRKVGTDLLAGESVKFGKRVLYRVHDVTALLRTGDNALGIIVGDGWYASYQAPAGRYAFGPAPRRVRAQLEVVYADGSRETIGTGAGWRSSASPIVSAELYNGEVYDARLEQPGWDRAGFAAADGWFAAELAAPPTAALVAQVSPPIRAKRTLRAIAITEPAPGRFVFDFGQNFAGWAQLTVRGAAGVRVEMRFAELLRPDGLVDQANLRAARCTDTYVLRGAARAESYQPHFTYHGFRYVEVSGYPGRPEVNSLLGIVMHSDLEETGSLRIDNPLVQKLWLNTLWSQRSNFFSVPTDCPQRDERLGWSGDAQVFWDTAAFNMDVGAFTRRFMECLRDDQNERGAFPIFAPAAGAGFGAPTATPAWSDAGIVLPWTAYQRYGDTQVISENWSAMTTYVAGILRDNPDYLWRNGRGIDFGDWLSLDGKTPGDATTPKDLLATAMLARSLAMLAQMAVAIGRDAEAAQYRALHAKVRGAFNAAFVQSDGTVGNGSHTSYILALALELLPDAQRAAAGAKLTADIRARGTLLSTGFVGTPISLDAVSQVDPALAFDLLFRTEFPSWGYMVRQGATTIWERWNGDHGDIAMNSFNHYALGAVCGFLYRRVAGIDAATPGFGVIRIAPVLDTRVKQWSADYQSVRGLISTRWKYDGQALELALTVPGNSRAEIHLPRVGAGKLLEAGRAVATRPDNAGAKVLVEVGAGQYHFRMT